MEMPNAESRNPLNAFFCRPDGTFNLCVPLFPRD